MADAPPPYSEVSGEKSATYPSAQGGYPPQTDYGTGSYPPPAQGSGSTVVVNQPTLTIVQEFHEIPVRTICPYCQADIVTATAYEAGTFSWLMCVILCLLGCDLGCCLIPFCVDGCQDVVHVCPNCHQQISRWGRM